MGWFGPALREQILHGNLSIAVTGAGSWLGQALLADLAAEGLLPPPGRLRLFARSARGEMEALAGAEPLRGGPWLLLHFAFLGKEKSEDRGVAEFVAANDAILAETQRLAAGARDLRVVFSSSGAVYQADRSLVFAPEASPYGWCKVRHEAAWAAWCGERGVPLVVPRIFSIGGPWINKVESYALSSMILGAARTGVIEIKARRPVFRSFVHVSELNGLLCEAAFGPRLAAPFDTGGLEIVEMADLAETVRDVLGRDRARVKRPVVTEAAADYYVGDGRMYRTWLAGAGRRVVDLHDIVRDTARHLSVK
jgi:nucleoside-diphosphate-sugar epimerase